MKTLFLFTLGALLAISLNARENPFALYEEETGKMYEFNENLTTPEAIQEAEYIKKVQQQMQNANKNEKKSTPVPPTPVVPKTYTKQEVDSLIQKTKQQTEQKAKEIVKKEIAKKEPEQVVYVKPRADVADDNEALTTKSILPFVKIEFNDNKILIHTTHEMFKKFSIEKEKKLALDFKGKVSFNSKKDNLTSKNFKSVAVGNHEKAGFFRVAVELANKPSKYSVDYKDNIVTIISK
ncbi:AMIN domain-containing protein [Aliarcobacter butzleri]|uniref:AMIN domain-containing protein n=1 Tax=Aliarcobacter butzleri TaxID=28197 RepID=UPI0021B2251F|nr:AMIN domain-containing protein [Aliarcobacter butzleri]MCT7537907.1 AMIN domain-containing protein [Aliarcobacter butzleri]MCT7624682.1 AMIN domain-containing protein [Aliarcobacter butzleri]